MKLAFYYAPFSSSSRVHWTLEELGVPYTKYKVDLARGEQREPAFLALNPHGKVPVLVIDDQPIFESHAQILFLAETFGRERGLWPETGTIAHAQALQWITWSAVSLSEALSRIFRNTSPRFPEDERCSKAGENAKLELKRLLGILDDHLVKNDFLLGSEFSIADISPAGLVTFLGRIGIDMSVKQHINAWAARCTARPAFGLTQVVDP